NLPRVGRTRQTAAAHMARRRTLLVNLLPCSRVSSESDSLLGLRVLGSPPSSLSALSKPQVSICEDDFLSTSPVYR
ncbi:hypothetical protein Dimus_013820, partial [Dionaea muscipula]